MADDTTTPEVTERAAEETAPAEQPAKPDLPPEVKRALTKANKEAETLRLRLKEFEDRDKTELQKLTEAREAAERRATDAEAGLIRFRVAAAKNLPAELADRLRGSTEDELATDADRLLELTGAKRAPDFDGGARTPAGKPTDMNALIRRQAGLG